MVHRIMGNSSGDDKKNNSETDSEEKDNDEDDKDDDANQVKDNNSIDNGDLEHTEEKKEKIWNSSTNKGTNSGDTNKG